MLKFSYYLCLASLALGQFSLFFKSDNTNLYLFDVLVMVFAFIGLISFLLAKRCEVPSVYYAFILFTFIAFISLFLALFKFNVNEVSVGAFYLFRFFSYLLSGIVIFNMLKNNLISREEVFKSIIISGLFLSIAGIIQLIVLPDFETLDPLLGWDPHKNRLASTFFDPNFTGAYLVICLSLLLDKMFLNRKISLFESLSFLLLTVALLLTFSRSAWAMMAVVIFIYGVFKSKALLFVAILIAFLAYFAVPRVQTRISGATDPADSASFRLVSWRNALTIAQDNLLIGVGFNTYRYAQRDYGYLDIENPQSHSGSGADSSLLFVLATTGVFGLAVYLFALLNPLLINQRNYLYMALTSGLLVDSLFINSLFYPQIMFLYFMITSFSFRK